MPASRRLPKDIVAAISASKILGIRAGTEPHRFIGVWVVVVEGRVFIRSWSLKPRSWYRTFLEDRCGALNIDDREVEIKPSFPRSERLLKAIDQAYAEKYNTPGSIKYVQDLRRAKSRRTTTELIPW